MYLKINDGDQVSYTTNDGCVILENEDNLIDKLKNGAKMFSR